MPVIMPPRRSRRCRAADPPAGYVRICLPSDGICLAPLVRPACSGADAQAAIHHLAQCAGQTLWQWLKPAAAVQMLHSLHTQLAGMRHPSHMARPLRGLKALVELLADGVTPPPPP